MFSKKLSEEDLGELIKREELILSYRLVSDALEMKKAIYLNGILPKYGCDLNKNYNIDRKTGGITEVERQPNQPQQPR